MIIRCLRHLQNTVAHIHYERVPLPEIPHSIYWIPFPRDPPSWNFTPLPSGGTPAKFQGAPPSSGYSTLTGITCGISGGAPTFLHSLALGILQWLIWVYTCVVIHLSISNSTSDCPEFISAVHSKHPVSHSNSTSDHPEFISAVRSRTINPLWTIPLYPKTKATEHKRLCNKFT